MRIVLSFFLCFPRAMTMRSFLFVCVFLAAFISPANGFPLPTPDIEDYSEYEYQTMSGEQSDTGLRSTEMSSSYIMALAILGALGLIAVALLFGCLCIGCLCRRQEARIDQLRSLLMAPQQDPYDIPDDYPAQLQEVIVERPGPSPAFQQDVQDGPEPQQEGGHPWLMGLIASFLPLRRPERWGAEAHLDPEDPEEEEYEHLSRKAKAKKGKKVHKGDKRGSLQEDQYHEENECSNKRGSHVDKKHPSGAKSPHEDKRRSRDDKKHSRDAKKSAKKGKEHSREGHKHPSAVKRPHDPHVAEGPSHQDKRRKTDHHTKGGSSSTVTPHHPPQHQKKSRAPVKPVVPARPKMQVKPKLPSRLKALPKLPKMQAPKMPKLKLPKPKFPKAKKSSFFGFMKKKKKGKFW